MREQETAFVGKITAGVSHDFLNVLAIIKERAGLIEDLMALDGQSFPHGEKLSKTIATIREQVRRGMEISERLNRFAHSMDEPQGRLNVNQFLDQLAFLMQRMARLKRVQLKVKAVDSSFDLSTDLFKLQMILAACLEYILGRTAGQGVIVLQCNREGGNFAIQCLGQPNSPSKDSVDTFSNLRAKLQEALEDLGIELCPVNAEDQIGLEIILPNPMSP
jgi:C4-dicarboxylate-specific signal transduction histidine kinase